MSVGPVDISLTRYQSQAIKGCNPPGSSHNSEGARCVQAPFMEICMIWSDLQGECKIVCLLMVFRED